jgi:exopolysaccharide biosynthesis polyprenyl glycosylphosphotransferase
MALNKQELWGGDVLALPSEDLGEIARSEPAARTGARPNADSRLRWLLATGDALALLLALTVALELPHQRLPGIRLAWCLVAIPLMIILYKIYGLYDRDAKRISHLTADDLPRVLHAALFGTILLWLYSKVMPFRQLDFAELGTFGVLTLLLTLCVRAGVRAGSSRTIGHEPALLIGSDNLGNVLCMKLAAHPEYRCRVIGALVEDRPEPAGNETLSVPVLGSLDELEQVVQTHGVRRVIVSSSTVGSGHQVEEVLRQCRQLQLKFSLLPKLSDALGSAVVVDDVEGVTVLGVNPPWLPRSSRALKRVIDLVAASVLLTLLAPLMMLLALAIKLDTHGPVLFAQRRVGRAGQRFKVYKFRTMVADAEERRAELLGESTDPNWLKLDHDPRITRVGGMLRRSSLDEIPQLWNVLRGQMSMVGPRPLIEDEDERIEGWARGRLDLTPGLTGYWQVLGRTRIPFDEMVKLDYLYVMNWSLWEDIRLMLRTLPILVNGRGAN